MPDASPLILATLLIVAVLIVSAVAKLREPAASASAFQMLELPKILTRLRGPRLLPLGELVLAAGLLLAPPPLRLVCAVVAAVLMLAYTAVIARALRFPYPVTCGCFGTLGMGLVTVRTLWRNLLLVAVALLAIVDAVRHDRSLTAQLADVGATGLGWLAMTVVTAAVAWLILDRGPAPRHTPAQPHTPAPAHHHANTPPPSTESGDYIREAVPYGVLETPDGRLANVREMAKSQARLLIFLSLHCHACITLREELPEFAEANPEIGVHPIYHSAVETDQIPGGMDWLLDPRGGLQQSFGVYGSPCAVLLGTDGLLAGGPVSGSTDVRNFLEDIGAELAAAREAHILPQA